MKIKIIPQLTFEEVTLGNIAECVGSVQYLEDNGADAVLLTFPAMTCDEVVPVLKNVCQSVDLPVIAEARIARLEDVKKYLYAGASEVVFSETLVLDEAVYPEAMARFGEDRCLKKETFSEDKIIPLSADQVSSFDGFAVKRDCREQGLPVNLFESAISWSDFKVNEAGLVPVIVQDYKTSEVLMMAYMNEAAFLATCETGRMTYYSRSRQSLWLKGETSGHFQYVKSLHLDCDHDTILAKVKQIGVACHTGARSCFFNELVKKDYQDANPLQVFEHVYSVIEDRKANPKEGSYTNYLFDKGIDKILKKLGEEATEIVIAAKNPDPEEIKYEISDFLYHAMVLMVERGVTWTDITKELANRE